VNLAEEVLFANPLKTQPRLVGRSVFDLDSVHKNTGPIFITAQDQSFEFIGEIDLSQQGFQNSAKGAGQPARVPSDVMEPPCRIWNGRDVDDSPQDVKLLRRSEI
jgi:hypothetical protein